jgi:hypothetical protein
MRMRSDRRGRKIGRKKKKERFQRILGLFTTQDVETINIERRDLMQFIGPDSISAGQKEDHGEQTIVYFVDTCAKMQNTIPIHNHDGTYGNSSLFSV